jgi:hypothetical protein
VDVEGTVVAWPQWRQFVSQPTQSSGADKAIPQDEQAKRIIDGFLALASHPERVSVVQGKRIITCCKAEVQHKPWFPQQLQELTEIGPGGVRDSGCS